MSKSAKRKAHDAAKATREPKTVAVMPKTVAVMSNAVQSNLPLQSPFAPVEISNEEYGLLSMWRHASVQFLMPEYDAIPQEFKRHYGKYHDVVTEWFFRGLGAARFIPREAGIDPQPHLRHLSAIMRSMEPNHEYKTAAVRFLLDKWFSDVVWTAIPEQERLA